MKDVELCGEETERGRERGCVCVCACARQVGMREVAIYHAIIAELLKEKYPNCDECAEGDGEDRA